MLEVLGLDETCTHTYRTLLANRRQVSPSCAAGAEWASANCPKSGPDQRTGPDLGDAEHVTGASGGESLNRHRSPDRAAAGADREGIAPGGEDPADRAAADR